MKGGRRRGSAQVRRRRRLLQRCLCLAAHPIQLAGNRGHLQPFALVELAQLPLRGELDEHNAVVLGTWILLVCHSRPRWSRRADGVRSDVVRFRPALSDWYGTGDDTSVAHAASMAAEGAKQRHLGHPLLVNPQSARAEHRT